MIRDILGGFLFSGDDVYKRAGVLSGGERTRLAVARMLLRPSNTLLLDEPTNHLDLDSKDVLLDALMDYGGTLIVVSHDRYFIDKLATKVVEIGNGHALFYPGTYEEFHWSKTQAGKVPALPDGLGKASRAAAPRPSATMAPGKPAPAKPAAADAESPSRRPPTARSGGRAPQSCRPTTRRRSGPMPRRASAIAHGRRLQARISDLESRIAEREQEIKALEAKMSAPGVLRQPRDVEAGHRSPPGGHVGSRRSDGPVGGPAPPRRGRRREVDRLRPPTATAGRERCSGTPRSSRASARPRSARR